jgi:formylglycine-generating enzyme required for sulfatase activity
MDLLDIPTGSRWDVEVEKALVESEIFMIIMTPASTSSDNVLDEISYAIDSGKRFIPVLLEKCNVPLRLRRFQYVDFTDKTFDEGVQSAKELLKNLMTQPTTPRADTAAEKQDPLITQQASKVQIVKDKEHDPTSAQKVEAPKQGRDSTTNQLRREKLEQELRFKAEETRLMQEKAELEKRLEEERSTRERMQAVAAQSRSRRVGILSAVVLVLLVSGFLALRFLVSLLPFNPLEPVKTPTLEATEPFVPITAPSVTPTQEIAVFTEAPVATEAATEAASVAPPSEITDDQGVDMVLVPAGDFAMGSDKGEADEQPLHTVYLDDYYIDKYEVTNKLYAACVDAGSCEPPRELYFFPESPNRIYFGNPQYDNYPVIYVDWNMAKNYCEWRDARLPTEAEWEKAARGTTDNIYPWGNDLDCQKANYQNCVNRTSEVGSYPGGVSPYGVYDMTGNVWEWVADWFADNYYATSSRQNPTGPITGQSRVLRGGAWPRYDVTIYHRLNFAPTYYTFDIGFRCARSE